MKRTVESEKLLFEVLMKFRDHREIEHKLIRETATNLLRLDRGKERFGQDWLQDLTILLIYYGTELSPREIINLTDQDIVKDDTGFWRIRSPLNKKWFLLSHDNELTTILECYRAQKTDDSASPLFVGKNSTKLSEVDIMNLVQHFSERPSPGTIAPYFSLSADEFAVIPTPLRINANPRYTGKGITIAFIDSGFYPHPDLIKPQNRVLAYVDITDQTAGWSEFSNPDISSWHGMQTSVSACGNGYLSQGLYRGIASDAKLVLIKASGQNRTERDNITPALEWAIEHRDQYNIRIINISLGSDNDDPDSPINKAVAEAVAAGIVVITAAGNDPHRPPTPPASAIAAITVGGSDDQNLLFHDSIRMYHSSYGTPFEGVLKPEIIAPAIWIAAPVLPGSPLYYESLILHKMLSSEDTEILEIYKKNIKVFSVKPYTKKSIDKIPLKDLRKWVEQRIKEEKLIATHYQHVDGTSFASPITASVIAQMLEVNPDLSPVNIKKILMGTAKQIEGVSPYIQGFGVISPYDAVEAALSNNIPSDDYRSPSPKIYKNYVTFDYFNPQVSRVHVVGDFNQWNKNALPMHTDNKGNWNITEEFLLPGRYRYKFLVDGKKWLHDPLNSHQENDGYNGKNSVFYIYTPGNAEEIFEKFLKTIRVTPVENTEIRKNAFRELDSILQSSLSNRSYRVRQFLARCMGTALDEIEQEKTPLFDRIKLWQFYNQGYIVKSTTLTIGFDVVTTRNVYNVFWNLEPTTVSALAELLDILIVTHRHPDHFDLELINTMIGMGKRVIIPHELLSLVPRGAIGMKPDEKRVFAFPGKKDESLIVKAHPGLHVYDQGRKIPHRIFDVETSTKIRFLHLGDHDYTSLRPKLPSCHIAFVKIGGISENQDDGESLKILTDKTRFQYLIAGHINELGHPVKGGRTSYHEAFEQLDALQVQSYVMAWGESLEIIPKGLKLDKKKKKSEIIKIVEPQKMKTRAFSENTRSKKSSNK